MDSRMMPDPADALRYHGGNINAARALFPDAPEPWIDLSTGINPRAYPVGRVAASVWSRLPEGSAVRTLEETARAAYRASEATGIVAVPGTQALIQWLPQLVPARRVAVLGETYGEHAKAWEAAGSAVVAARALSELADYDVGVVVNPNNPDGRLLRPEALLEVAARLAGQGGLLVVDEAFMDVIGGDASLAPRMPRAGAIVMRSFGKTFGLAGLRLGFALGSPALADAVRTAFGPWSVSGPAIDIGVRALNDTRWLDKEKARLLRDASRLDKLLTGAGFSLVGGTPLFRLVRHTEAGAWFQRLCRAGILARPFALRSDLLRFGIPSGPPAWRRLSIVLA